MKLSDNNQTEILESREALTFYLETLFTEQPVEVETQKETVSYPDELDLLFTIIGEHKIALPVKDLKTVMQLSEKQLVTLPEKKPFTIGHVRYQGKNIPVNDIHWAFNATGALQAPKTTADISSIKHVIVLSDEAMAICCDKVLQIKTVNRKDIKWSRSKPNQRWLKGIITEDMSTVINIPDIKRLFLRGYSSIN